MCGFISVLCISADDLREAVFRPAELVMLSFHQFVQQALKSIEQRGSSSSNWLRGISNFVQKISNSS